MANVNAPFGLRPIQSATGSASNFENVQAQIATANLKDMLKRGDFPTISKAVSFNSDNVLQIAVDRKVWVIKHDVATNFRLLIKQRLTDHSNIYEKKQLENLG